jgi:SAM-dependent methyltransferase
VDLKEEALLGGQVHRHWYYRAKLAALLRAIEPVPSCHVLDVGAGSGFFARSLLEAGRAEQAICIDPGYPEDRDEMVSGKPLLYRRALAEPDPDVKLVMMMDVLEHVEDDEQLVREYVDQVPSGAHVIVTVPAFRWLWSGHDVFLEHYRRYSLPGLEKVLRASGLKVEFASYYYGAILPLAAGFRLGKRLLGEDTSKPKSDMRQFGPLLNSLFWGACRAELPFLGMNRIGGLSVCARAVKP